MSTKHTKKPTIFVTFYVKIYPILLKNAENTPSKRKISHPSKIWRKKIFQKKNYRERHTRSEASTKGGMALIYSQLRLYDNSIIFRL